MSRFDRTAGDGFHQADDILNIRCSVAVDIAERDIRITVYLRRKACRPENGIRVRFKQRYRAERYLRAEARKALRRVPAAVTDQSMHSDIFCPAGKGLYLAPADMFRP